MNTKRRQTQGNTGSLKLQPPLGFSQCTCTNTQPSVTFQAALKDRIHYHTVHSPTIYNLTSNIEAEPNQGSIIYSSKSTVTSRHFIL